MDNRFFKAFLILLGALLLVAAYPGLYERVPWLQQAFRTYPGWERFVATPEGVPEPDTLASQPVDTVSETTSPPAIPSADPEAVTFSEEAARVMPLTGTYQGLESLTRFFEALRDGQEQVRIAYFGDSSIEGDLISQTFRDGLQRRFGGHGVGFVPITSKFPAFRRSVRHSFSRNWATVSLEMPNYLGYPRGISGAYYLAGGPIPSSRDSVQADTLAAPSAKTDPFWVEYRGSGSFEHSGAFSVVRLFYGPSMTTGSNRPPRVWVKAGEDIRNRPLSGQALVNTELLADTLISKVRIGFEVDAHRPIYGVSLESETGVVVDNFSSRGNNGYALRRITQNSLSAFQENLDYDLVILQFGLNVIDPRLKDFSWYERQLDKVIAHFQEALPGVPILLIGVSDKGIRINGKMQTDPSVPLITETQRRAAEKHQIGINCHVMTMEIKIAGIAHQIINP